MAAYHNPSYSNLSAPAGGPIHSGQVSTTTLLNALHSFYTSGQPYQLDAATSIAVNTWVTAARPDGSSGGIVDRDLAIRAWEHARRRAEDGCIVLCSTHQSTPSLLAPFLAELPLATPSVTFTALSVIRPFLSAVTSFNPTYSLHSALAASYTFALHGNVVGLTLALSTSGINVRKGLLDIPREEGFRAFDVIYYLLTSASSPAEREFLDLKDASSYSLLNKSGTFTPPSYLPVADDSAAAEDFRSSLKTIGINGDSRRGLLSVLAGLLKLGDAAGFLIDREDLEDICEDVGGLLGLDPEILLQKCTTDDREVLIAGIYEALVDWVISKANDAIASEIESTMDDGSSSGGHQGHWSNDDTVSLTVIDIPRPVLGKAVAMRGVFDDSLGINAEMAEDGVEIPSVGHSVMTEMRDAVSQVEADLGIPEGPALREREFELDKRQEVLEKVGVELETDAFLRQVLFPVDTEGIAIGKRGRFDLAATLGSSRVWYHISIHPTDDSPSSLNPSSPSLAWFAGTVSRQLRDWRLPEWANRRLKHLDFTADFDVEEFVSRYSPLGCSDGKDGVENWILERGWSNGDAVVGLQRIWMRENAWWDAETMLDLKTGEEIPVNPFVGGSFYDNNTAFPFNAAGAPMADTASFLGSRDDLLNPRHSTLAPSFAGGEAKSVSPSTPGDYGLGRKGDDKYGVSYYDNDYGQYVGDLDPEFGEPKHIEKQPIGKIRRAWVAFVWALTFWIPSPFLRYVGRMKRPEVRMAWREKIVLVFLILLFNAFICFWIIALGKVLCPNKDKVWSQKEVSWHQSDNEFFVSIHGNVYDISKFYKIQHSDKPVKTSSSTMKEFAGQNLDAYFPPPLTRMCQPFVTDESVSLTPNDTNAIQNPQAKHDCGPVNQPDKSTALHKITWYESKFLPKINEYYKGRVVWKKKDVAGQADSKQRYWAIINKSIYDLTDYFHTQDVNNNQGKYNFLPSEVTKLFKDNPGTDISKKWKDTVNFQNAKNCLDNVFYVGEVDFRDSARCTANNWILLSFTILICVVILVKFLSALQLGSKREPAQQDKFVTCLVPAYTEGEDALRKGLDSLTSLKYDNKRKLLCVICDGMIVGGGNDRPTPKIVLDILGVDPKVDPPALPFLSVGQGSDQLNYGKVYSGLYEYEGNVVPYIVIVKVGKESEQSKSKPGNRGKRDTQLLLLRFLNRVHHRAPMSPLELEVFHQINNIIGVDPELYEYCFMVDADTSVKEDSLNRLVAACANDSKIAGICGETSLQNEERSWWTMIQVYEYYISHNLAKCFESLFGSVTCLPGCFSLYRLRTADKGRPIIIADQLIEEYSDNDIHTLHKKNLFSLGEDRYLTTLMTKHFPKMSYKFIPDAYAATAAPETWGVLLSQRRRWINSTVHNLAELATLDDLCGFCCFSMRFVVLVDLFGTIMLPATCVYLVYLVYRLASHTGPIPVISIAIIAGVYGLQAIIFIIKKQWQHIGWMFIYLLGYPLFSFVLPLYSFWYQDDFSWGNTRVVIGEKGDKRVIAVEDEGFDPRSIPLQRWDDYALANNLPGRRGDYGFSQEKLYPGPYSDEAAMEMDDMHSMYSSVKPASTILTGVPGRNAGAYMPPPSPAPFVGNNTPGNRASHLSGMTWHSDSPQRHMSMGNLSAYRDSPIHVNRHSMGYGQSMGNLSGYHDNPMSASRHSMGPGMGQYSTDNLLGGGSRPISRSPLGGGNGSRPASTVLDFRTGPVMEPDEPTIVEVVRNCLGEVDLDKVTKKQVRVLVEQRLQTTLSAEKKVFLDQQIDNELANM